jgi:hypothetical protein
MVFNLAGFAVMLPALGALWAFNKKGNARGKLQTVINWLKMGLAFVAGCGMAFTFLGSGLAAVIGWVSGLSPALKVGIPLALVLAAGLLALLDIAFDRPTRALRSLPQSLRRCWHWLSPERSGFPVAMPCTPPTTRCTRSS